MANHRLHIDPFFQRQRLGQRQTETCQGPSAPPGILQSSKQPSPRKTRDSGAPPPTGTAARFSATPPTPSGVSASSGTPSRLSPELAISAPGAPPQAPCTASSNTSLSPSAQRGGVCLFSRVGSARDRVEFFNRRHLVAMASQPPAGQLTGGRFVTSLRFPSI